MAKKTLKKKTLKKKTVASKSKLNQLADPVLESAHDIWLAGLGAFAVAQEESGKIVGQGSKMFDKLVSEGAKLEKEKRQQAEAGLSDVKGKVTGKVTGVRNQVEGQVDQAKKQVQDNWDKLEAVFEERVARVMGRLGVPTADEIRNLTRQVETLNAKVAKLSKKSATKKAAPKASKEVIYHLLPKGDDWTVRLEGTEKDISIHPKKSEALDAARGVAQANEPSRLVVHKADGTIQNSYNYGEAA